MTEQLSTHSTKKVHNLCWKKAVKEKKRQKGRSKKERGG